MNKALMTTAWSIILIAAFDIGLSEFGFSLIGLLTNATLITIFNYLVLVSAIYGLYSMFTMKH
jgi:hypothetical protein